MSEQGRRKGRKGPRRCKHRVLPMCQPSSSSSYTKSEDRRFSSALFLCFSFPGTPSALCDPGGLKRQLGRRGGQRASAAAALL